jgi:hypothetical protein
VNARWTIDGSPRSNVARYINHSCRANADPIIRDRRIRIKAIKNIEAGDEITYDYGKDHFNAYIKPHGCLCDKCREKRRKERAEVRAANARRRRRADASALKLQPRRSDRGPHHILLIAELRQLAGFKMNKVPGAISRHEQKYRGGSYACIDHLCAVPFVCALSMPANAQLLEQKALSAAMAMTIAQVASTPARPTAIGSR